MIPEPIASVLRSGRDVFNQKFAEARRVYPDLDANVFNEFIQTTLDPIALVCSLPADQRTALIMAAYDVGLELTGEQLIGDDIRGRILKEAWRKIVPANWLLAASGSHQLFGSISNAVHNLSVARSCRPEEWIANMARFSPECPDLGALMKVGQVLAWRAGMAQMRRGVLEVAATLPTTLACAAFGAPASANWQNLHDRLVRDRWFDPSEPNQRETRTLRVATKVGAFRGLGGIFTEPPLVAASHDQLFVRSGDQCWLLLADVFGHSFHSVKREEFELARAATTASDDIRVAADQISVNGQAVPNPLPDRPTSFAVLPDTIALTSALTYSVVLLAY
jgi:hypothetical protein